MSLDADYLPVAVGREPLFAAEGSAAGCHFYISRAAVEKVELHGPEWKFRDLQLVRPTLRNPLSVFEGLGRADYEDGYCYVAKHQPAEPNDIGQSGVDLSQFLFLVYVKKDRGLVVFDWGWRRESSQQPGHPQDWERDFTKGRIWPA